MVEKYEKKDVHEQIGKNIDNLDRDINNLDNKVQTREDFTEHFQDLQNIYNKIISLENDINGIQNKEIKKNLKGRLDNLKMMMLDFVSDGSIDNFINGKTKNSSINTMVGDVNKIFYSEMNNLVKTLQQKLTTNLQLNDILLETSITEKQLIGNLQILGLPYGGLYVSGQPYLGFVIPWTGEIYALVDGKIKMCEADTKKGGKEDRFLINKPSEKKSENNGLNFSYSKKPTDGGINNKGELKSLGEKETWKVSWNPGNYLNWLDGVNVYTSLVYKGVGVPETWLGVSKGFKNKLGNTEISASYSPGYPTKSKDVYKGTVKQNFKFKNGLNFSVNETLKIKASDFSNLINNLSTEIIASRKKNNINLSAIANLNYRGAPTFIGLSGKITI